MAQAQLVVAEVTQDSARAAGAASDAEAALVDIGERVKKATGSDPETVRAIAEASERARALVTSLSALSGKVPRGLLAGASGRCSRRSARAARARKSPTRTTAASRVDDVRGERSRASRGSSLGASSATCVALEAEPRDTPGVQRAVHALKGSAGLAGERELAATLERLHRRVKEGDETRVRRGGGARAHGGRSASRRVKARSPRSWPIPPDDLVARPLDPLVRAQYAAEVTDRLARIDEALVDGRTTPSRQCTTSTGTFTP